MYYHNIAWNIQTTNDCFLDCAYCMTAESNKMKLKAPVSHVAEALRLSKGFQNVFMVFIGGEPLMAGKEWFRQAFKLLDEHPVKVQPRIYTNGHLLDDEWCDLLSSNNCQVVFSYDGLGNGAKGSKRSHAKLCQYSKLITYATMTLNIHNYKGLIDCYKEVSEAGVKRFALQFDIYATSEQMTLFGKEVCKLFKYIEENPNGARFSTYKDIQSLLKGGRKPLSNEFESPVMNNDWCVNAAGELTIGVPDCADPDWQFGNVKDIRHINDVVFTDRMRKINEDFIESLNYMGEFEEVNRLTNGGGFFFDKKGIMPMNRPNFPKLHAYRELFNYFREEN